MSEEVKALLIEAVNLLRRIAGPPPAVPEVPPIAVPPPAVPTLEVIVEKFEEIVEVLGVPFEANYMTEKGLPGKGSVDSSSPVDEDIVDILDRKARYGYIYSETGTITVKFNTGADITLKVSDSINLVDLHLEVERLEITTTSPTAQTYRLLLI